MEMRSLYPVGLAEERESSADLKTYNDLIKKNESCLNMNFSILADKIYEFELRLAVLEAARDA